MSRQCRFVAFLACLIAALLPWRPARAQNGGFFAVDQGTPSSGAAQAGAGALARDATTAYLNPAAMTRLEGTDLLFGIQATNVRLQFETAPGTTPSGGGGGDAGGWLPGGSVYVVHGFRPRWRLGFSVTAPAGSALDYDDTWAGRYFVREGLLAIVNMAPAVGYRINDRIAVGGRVNVQYAKFRQTIAVNRGMSQPDGEIELDQDSWGVGASLSAYFEPASGTRLGLNYHSFVDHSLSGDLGTLSGFTTSSNTSLPMPQALNLALSRQLGTQWTLLADTGWSDWSAFDKSVLSVEVGSGVAAEIPRHWEDTWHLGGGFQYRRSPEWMFQAGAAYDSSPVSDADRTPDLPVDRAWRVSGGVERSLQGRRLSLTYTYLDLGANPLDAQLNALTGRLVGHYGPAGVHVIGFSVSLGS